MNASAAKRRSSRLRRASRAMTREYARAKRREVRSSERNCSFSLARSNLFQSASITSVATLLRRSGWATMNPSSSPRIEPLFKIPDPLDHRGLVDGVPGKDVVAQRNPVARHHDANRDLPAVESTVPAVAVCPDVVLFDGAGPPH